MAARAGMGIASLDFELKYYEEAHKIRQELTMPYVSTFEKVAEKRGIAKGIEQGIEQGVHKGEIRIFTFILRQKFGKIPKQVLQKIDSADNEVLLQWTGKALTVDSMEEIFED